MTRGRAVLAVVVVAGLSAWISTALAATNEVHVAPGDVARVICDGKSLHTKQRIDRVTVDMECIPFASTTTRSSTTTRPSTTTSSTTTSTTSTSTTTTTSLSPPTGCDTLLVGSGRPYATLQAALDVVQPCQTIRLDTVGVHAGLVTSKRSGLPSAPIILTAIDGARLDCGSPLSGQVARCFQLQHSWYSFNHFSIEGGSSNLYMVGPSAGVYVHDVKVLNSTFRGARGGGTGECIRVKYQAFNVEISSNDIRDCGLGKFGVNGSKNGEGVYIGTAPEQLSSKNPSSEPDRTNHVWAHDNNFDVKAECAEVKEAGHDNLIEHNICAGQSDTESGAFGSRGGRVGEGNVFRDNIVNGAVGACVRFGGDVAPDGTGNDFYRNTCNDIHGTYGVNQQREPQGKVCENTFNGVQPSSRLSRTTTVDPTASCS